MSGNNGVNWTGLDDADFARVMIHSAYGSGLVIRVWKRFVLADVERLVGHIGPGVRMTILGERDGEPNGWSFTTGKRKVRKCT